MLNSVSVTTDKMSNDKMTAVFSVGYILVTKWQWCQEPMLLTSTDNVCNDSDYNYLCCWQLSDNFENNSDNTLTLHIIHLNTDNIANDSDNLFTSID